MRRVDKWEDSIEVRVGEKNDHEKIKIQGQLPKKVNCGAMWVNAGLGIMWKNVTHPIDRTTN